MRSVESRLSEIQKVELWAWHLAKKALGSYKAKARELGICAPALYEYIHKRTERERRDKDRRKAAVRTARMSVYEQMAK